MSYTVVEKTVYNPSRCAVSNNGEGPFLDTGAHLQYFHMNIPPRIYLNVQVLKDMSKVVGMVDGEDYEDKSLEANAAHERIAELEEELKEHRKFRESVEYTFDKMHVKPKAKPGRKVTA